MASSSCSRSFPAGAFQVADCVADGGLHGRLFVGPRRTCRIRNAARSPADLSALTIRLSRNGALADTGSGANVLDGPVQALAHLVAVLAKDRLNPPLRAGEIVTTGTLTRAFPVLPGERWSTEIEGFDLPGLSVEIPDTHAAQAAAKAVVATHDRSWAIARFSSSASSRAARSSASRRAR